MPKRLLSVFASLLLACAVLPDRALSAPADLSRYPVFPDEDAGADPSVPAEKGGKGFGKVAASLGWKTNVDFDLIGDPRAVKGGEITLAFPEYPNNFLPVGPQSNTYFNTIANGLTFDSLLSMHSNTQEWIPNLATHWRRSEDGLTFSYRINPNAKWADGSPVTADDVVATHALLTDETLGDPAALMTWRRFKRPVAESRYIVTVACNERHWLNFLHFSSLQPFPAKMLGQHENAGKWVEAYKHKLMTGNGAYECRLEDMVPGTSVSLRRRPDYWAAKARANAGLNNFDKITYILVTDGTIEFERLKKGDLTMMGVRSARQWVVDLDPAKVELIKRGLLQKRRIFTEAPQGFQGLAINMRRAPYDDVRVRKALAHLFDRKTLLKKLMFNQYLPLHSYYPGGPYENPGNPRNEYDPEKALALLAEAGWKERNAGGQLVNAKGEPFTIRVLYGNQMMEKHLTLYQETLKQAGITATMELIKGEELWQRVSERKFEMAMMAWSANLFPNPELEIHSSLANVPNNNNICGVADPRIDALVERYKALDIEQLKERCAIVQEIDGILAEMHPYVLAWYAPYERFIFWDVLSHPEPGLTRTADDRGMLTYWWLDPEKSKALEKARKEGAISLPLSTVTIKHWRKKGKDDDPEASER